jgi:hypothetical protein
MQCNACTVPFFPGIEAVDELIAIFAGPDLHDLEEDRPQDPGISPFGMPSAPGESLALDMHQAALDDDLRPYGA